jgi:16S rRNA (cytosine967-C5)-methyltransferase
VSGQKPREIAIKILQRSQGDEYVEKLLEETLAKARLSAADRGLCQELTFGVIRWQSTLDWLIARKTAQAPQKEMVRNLLRLGLYQLFILDRIPGHAAVYETVEMAKHLGLGSQTGFINAILRGYAREFDATKQLLAELRDSTPHLGYSHPEWLVARWEQRWGRDKVARLLQWNNTPPKVFARVNTLKADAGKLLEQWRSEGVEYDFLHRDWLEENLAFELKSHPPLKELPSFRDGLFYVQDPSTLLAINELDPQSGNAVLDMCAAPGGKLTYAAQRMRNEGRLLAHDTSAARIKLITENCARLGVKDVEMLSPEGMRAQTPRKFDRILIDAPCSNTGVMRRRVDLRWRIRKEEIARLQATQMELLAQAVPLLKAGGTLVYSTCSLEPEENEAVLKSFLQRHPELTLSHSRELLPFVDEVDGAFVARLVRAGGKL